MSDESPLTILSSYQEAIRLSVSIDLRSAIHGVHLSILKGPDLLNPFLALEAKSAYWSAVTTLIQTNVPLSEEIVHGDLEYLQELVLQIEADAS